MKIKVKELDYDSVCAIPKPHHKKPVKPTKFIAKIMQAVSKGELKAANFSYETIGMENLGPDEPALFLMNHSCFMDLKMAAMMLKDRPFNIICTSDGFVGKEGLMRRMGCIPTQKFVRDITLIRDMSYTLKNLNSSILMYPEASYSFDGTATPLPESLGKLVQLLKVPVIMIKTYGAFQHDPLYNNLQLRNVKVTATMEYLLSPEKIKGMTHTEINNLLNEEFSFDNFQWQKDNGILINEPFRADCLNRVLYKCPDCGTEGETEGKGIYLTCHACNKKYELAEDGSILSLDGNSKFTHIPDWYKWERESVKEELLSGSYKMEDDVEIYMMVNMDCIYHVGDGHLVHDTNGWTLDGCDGRLHYNQGPLSCYSLYSDFYWYELGDMICVGDNDVLYYCFPKNAKNIVAKARLATEELYKIKLAEIKK